MSSYIINYITISNVTYIIKKSNTMKKLYTDEEFKLTTSRQLLPFQCECCGSTFYKEKKRINSSTINLNYCSILCKNIHIGTY